MNYQEVYKTNDAKKNFIKGLVRLAKVDGSISPEEEQYFLNAAVSIGLNEKEIAEIEASITADGIIQVRFESYAEKLLFFREGIQLCAVDESYDEEERAEIRLMAVEFGIPEDVILRIEEWVEEGMKWKARGDEFLTIG